MPNHIGRYLIILGLFLGLIDANSQSINSLRDSLKAATNLLAQHPDSIDLYLKRASWNVLMANWTNAKDDYDRILTYDEHNPAALFYRAYVNQQLGRMNFARLDYENYLKILPGNFEGQLGLILLNEKDKHYTEAMDGINRLVQQFPDSAIAYAARANIEKERGLYYLAEYDYTQAIIRDSANQDYFLQRIEIYITQKKYTDAKRDLDILSNLGLPSSLLQEYYRRMN